MGLVEKVEGEVEIKSAADKIHEVFSRKQHQMSTMTPIIHGCDLDEGEWGKQGSVLIWTFMHDGEKKVTRELVEVIDNVNYSTTFKVLEGDTLKNYKRLRSTVKVTPKREGSVVHWTVEYERMTPQTPPPITFVDALIENTKAFDAYLISQF